MSSPLRENHSALSPLAISLLQDISLNSTQAARVLGVQRPVISTWVSRHTDFPQPIDKHRNNHTYYQAAKLIEWASARDTVTRSVDEMVYLAAIEGNVEACKGLNLPIQEILIRFSTLILMYRSVEYRQDERPLGLLRRCAGSVAARPLLKHIESELLGMSDEQFRVLGRVAGAVAEYSSDYLSDLQRVTNLLASQDRGQEQLSVSLLEFLARAASPFAERMHMRGGAPFGQLVTVQLLQTLVGDVDEKRRIHVSSSNDRTAVLLRLIVLLSNEEQLLEDHSPVATLEDDIELTSVWVHLPLHASYTDSIGQWAEINSVVSDSPVGRPIFVVGRADVLGSKADPGSDHYALAEYGHLIALVDLGTKHVLGESGVQLMLGIFENRRIDEGLVPYTALLDASSATKVEPGNASAPVLHDLHTVLVENRLDSVHVVSGEHILTSGVRARSRQLAESGFSSAWISSMQRQSANRLMVTINESLRVVNTVDYSPARLDWPVKAGQGENILTLQEARENGKVKRIPGAAREKLADFAQPTEEEADSLGIRIIDVEAMQRVRETGSLPAEYFEVSVSDLSSIGRAEPAQVGDLLVYEGEQPSVLVVSEHHGLVVPQSPVFTLRRRYESLPSSTHLAEIFAGIVLSELQVQNTSLGPRASWLRVRLGASAYSAIFEHHASEWAEVEKELNEIRAHRQVLQAQIDALNAIESNTLKGFAEGTLEINTKG